MKENTLAAVPVFADLTVDERERVAQHARLEQFETGSTLIEEGDYAMEVLAILEGDAAVFHEGVLVGELGKGDFLGELGAVPGQRSLAWGRRKATVVAKSPMTVAAIPGHEMRTLVRDVPALREAIERKAAERKAELAEAESAGGA